MPAVQNRHEWKEMEEAYVRSLRLQAEEEQERKELINMAEGAL